MDEPRFPYHPNNPPIDAPDGCANRLMWQLARRLFTDHQPGPGGLCLSCLPVQFYPCIGRQLADLGLRSACERTDPTPWRSLPVQPDRRNSIWRTQ